MIDKKKILQYDVQIGYEIVPSFEATVDKILDNYTDIVHEGWLDEETHTIGTLEDGTKVSIEKDKWLELHNIIMEYTTWRQKQ